MMDTDPPIVVLPEGGDSRLWIRLSPGGERLYLVGAGHTFPGRMSAWVPSERRSVSVSKAEIVDASPEAELWIAGFLVGNEPVPPDSNDEEVARYWEANREYRRRGAWPSSFGLELEDPDDNTLADLSSLGPADLVDAAFIDGPCEAMAKRMLAIRLAGQKVWYPVRLVFPLWSEDEVQQAVDATLARLQVVGTPDPALISALSEVPDPRVSPLLRRFVMRAFEANEVQLCVSLLRSLARCCPDEPWEGYRRLVEDGHPLVATLASRFPGTTT